MGRTHFRHLLDHRSPVCPRRSAHTPGGAPVMSREVIKALPRSQPAAPKVAPSRTLWGDAWRRFVRNRLAVVGLILVIGIFALGLGAPLISPHGYNDQVLTEVFQFPSAAHPLGTDYLGRDMLARVA